MRSSALANGRDITGVTTHSYKRALRPFLLIYSFNDCFVIENALVYKPDRWLHKQCTPSISVTTTTTAAVAAAAAAHDT